MNALTKSSPHLMTKRKSPNRGSFSLLDKLSCAIQETAVSIIKEYVDRHLFSPSFSWPKDEFEKRSYSQWAAYEIINRIMNKPFEMPICIIESFICEMAMYAFLLWRGRASQFDISDSGRNSRRLDFCYLFKRKEKKHEGQKTLLFLVLEQSVDLSEECVCIL